MGYPLPHKLTVCVVCPLTRLHPVHVELRWSFRSMIVDWWIGLAAQLEMGVLGFCLAALLLASMLAAVSRWHETSPTARPEPVGPAGAAAQLIANRQSPIANRQSQAPQQHCTVHTKNWRKRPEEKTAAASVSWASARHFSVNGPLQEGEYRQTLLFSFSLFLLNVRPDDCRPSGAGSSTGPSSCPSPSRVHTTVTTGLPRLPQLPPLRHASPSQAALAATTAVTTIRTHTLCEPPSTPPPPKHTTQRGMKPH